MKLRSFNLSSLERKKVHLSPYYTLLYNIAFLQEGLNGHFQASTN